MATDEPSQTRWSFQDFKLFYDIKFGRKKSSVAKDEAENRQTLSNGSSPVATSNGNGYVKNTTDLSIYEQYNQERGSSTHSNGVSSARIDEKPQRSLLPPFESAEMRALGESLSRDIIRGNPDVKWESIKGLENAKRLLKEAVVMPIKYPKYFTGLLSPWKGILLFGPPGTGKTMLAKAVATECNTTFFNISASSVVSKWRGDSEKLIKVLFELARHHAPSTIFLDEIDAIISQRGEARSEHEASRRLKTELLIQMDGLTRSDELVFVLAATNLPWELDAAMLRRLEKRILVPLPEPEARKAMFEELLPSASDGEHLPYDLLVEKTEGYSGSDIRLLCKEAAMQPLRRLMAFLEEKQEMVPEDELPKVGPITERDIDVALRNTRPSAHLHAHRYDKFNDDYGSQVLQ
ncbi:katanin p60 ATPase-containing subunit A-like 2 isoform X1 [Ipomoea triloba]|uniref:katanin p60 ATPase-containing subunit A-like 2 isoform X1 n=1 Tax=Ipomoea triloba TaxID=35885 RepID=UPI00125D270B|nr:katanin p60 ATPase-containing subunit A-like 2 isoform X1 [Ipomoea triloba]GMD86611.1 katanin P60 ATPase-containing subunit A-like 2 isoform X1 [Ipomoea batatas]